MESDIGLQPGKWHCGTAGEQERLTRAAQSLAPPLLRPSNSDSIKERAKSGACENSGIRLRGISGSKRHCSWTTVRRNVLTSIRHQFVHVSTLYNNRQS